MLCDFVGIYYHSEKYPSLITLREKAANVVITTYDEVP